MLVNIVRLKSTINKFGVLFLRYPQFIISPCFSPLMYEGIRTNTGDKSDAIQIWRVGSIFNAIFIGIVPLVLLIVSDIERGVTSWTFHETIIEGIHFQKIQQNTSVFKHPFGNIAAASIFIVIFSFTIVTFFFTKELFRTNGIYCRLFNVLICPCPQPCLSFTPNNESDGFLSTHPMIENNFPTRPITENGADINIEAKTLQQKSIMYLYHKGGNVKTWLVGEEQRQQESMRLQVNININHFLCYSIIFIDKNNE